MAVFRPDGSLTFVSIGMMSVQQLNAPCECVAAAADKTEPETWSKVGKCTLGWSSEWKTRQQVTFNNKKVANSLVGVTHVYVKTVQLPFLQWLFAKDVARRFARQLPSPKRQNSKYCPCSKFA